MPRGQNVQADQVSTVALDVLAGFFEGTGGDPAEDLINAGTAGSNANFVSGAGQVAVTGEATFAFDITTNILTFDADGTGATAAVVIGTFTGGPALTAASFTIA